MVALGPVALLLETQLEVAVGKDAPGRRRAAPLDHEDHAADVQDVARRDLDRLAWHHAIVAQAGGESAAEIGDADRRSHREHRVARRDRRIVDLDFARGVATDGDFAGLGEVVRGEPSFARDEDAQTPRRVCRGRALRLRLRQCAAILRFKARAVQSLPGTWTGGQVGAPTTLRGPRWRIP